MARSARSTVAAVLLALMAPGIALVVFTVERRTAGRRSGTRCLPGRKRGRRCVAWVRRKGSFSLAGKTGANSVRFPGRGLPAGSYRLVATPAGGTAVRVAFMIVRR